VTEKRMTHLRARYDLGRHVEEAHPDKYHDVLARAGQTPETDPPLTPKRRPRVPIIAAVPRHPLTPEELPLIRAWAQSRAAFRPDADPPDGIPEINGGYSYGGRFLSLDELVEKWRSLGRPEPRVKRTRPQTSPRYRGKPGGIGAARGARRRIEGV